MAITHDASTDGGENVTSFSHTCTGSNLVLVVTVAIRDRTADDVTGITYNGVSLTEAIRADDTGAYPAAEIWYLIGPATGSNTVAVSGLGGDDTHCSAVSFAGVTQTSSLEKTAENFSSFGANPTVTLSPDTDNTVIVAVHSNESGNEPTVGSGETSIYMADDGTWGNGAEYAIQTTATSQAMNFVNSDSDQWQAAAANFLEDAGGAAGIRSMRQLVGHGQGTRD